MEMIFIVRSFLRTSRELFWEINFANTIHEIEKDEWTIKDCSREVREG